MNLDTDWFYRRGASGLYRLFDRGLNAINAGAERIFYSLVSQLSFLAREAPALVVLLFAVPYQAMKGNSRSELDSFKRRIYRTFETGTLPVGLGAAAAGVVFVLFVWWNG